MCLWHRLNGNQSFSKGKAVCMLKVSFRVAQLGWWDALGTAKKPWIEYWDVNPGTKEGSRTPVQGAWQLQLLDDSRRGTIQILVRLQS